MTPGFSRENASRGTGFYRESFGILSVKADSYWGTNEKAMPAIKGKGWPRIG